MLRRLGRHFDDAMPMRIEERRRIIAALYPEGTEFAPFVRRFSLLMSVAVAIAVFGLIADSTAVVIGAMLVAPLLTPILGLSAAIIMGWPRRLLRYAIVVVVASAAATMLAGFIAYAVRLELDPIPSELLARTAPNLRDLGIALAAGVAGAFAIVRRAAGDAMSGAAVAVALVPPLSAVGILFQQGEPDLAIGAFVLFTTNVAGVVMAAAVTFIASGFVPGMQLFTGAKRTVGRLRWIALAVVVVVLPIQLDQPGLLQPAPAFEEITARIQQWTGNMEAAIDVVAIDVDVDEGTAFIDLIVTTNEQPEETYDSLAADLSEHLNRPVELSVQEVPAQISEVSADESG
jgi:uncharacterized hydrophobic protein (TIGR00271 family)